MAVTHTYLRRVGIVTMPTGSKEWITENNVRWFTERGIDIVPIPYRTKRPEIYMRKVHGLYLQGGPGYDLRYMATIKKIFELAIQANRRSEYFPIWGTCHGFQSLLIAAGNMNLDGSQLDGFDSNNFYKTHLNITVAAKKTSKLLRSFSDDFLDYITHDDPILFLNQRGLTPRHFYANRLLPSVFQLVATAHDRNGKSECAIIEGRQYPFYGTQFHSESLPILEPFREFFIEALMKNKKKMNHTNTRSFHQTHTSRFHETRKKKIYKTYGDSRGYVF